jgi:peptidoglycan/xylan/chitin deacetylase (PgdA/CDA1 family)
VGPTEVYQDRAGFHQVPPGRILLWLASLGGLALLARSLLLGPVDPWIALAAFFGYLTVVIVGAMVPQLEMYGDVLCRGLPGAQGAALTFDDGPDPDTTPRVLDALRRAGARATFFVIGEKAERHPEIVRRMVAEGHLVALHGYRHDRLYAFKSPSAVADDIRRAADVVEAATGVRPRWFRPPLGYVSPRTAAGARRAGVEIVGWTARALDGLAGRSPRAVVMRLAPALTDRAILLLHDASERGGSAPAGVAALPDLLAEADRRRLPLVTVDALIDVSAEAS